VEDEIIRKGTAGRVGSVRRSAIAVGNVHHKRWETSKRSLPRVEKPSKSKRRFVNVLDATDPQEDEGAIFMIRSSGTPSLFTIPVWVWGRQLDCLLDTGGAVNLIGGKALKFADALQFREKDSGFKLFSANESEIPVVGLVDLDVVFRSPAGEEFTARFTFHVAPNYPGSFLLSKKGHTGASNQSTSSRALFRSAL